MNRPKVTIRAMRGQDIAAALKLWKSTPGVGLGNSDTPGELRKYLKRHGGISSAAFAGKTLIGAVLCGDDGRRGYMHHLAVEPAWRKRGIGKALAKRCLAGLRRRGIVKCNGFLYFRNMQGRKFWRRIGWNVRRDLAVIQRGIGSRR